MGKEGSTSKLAPGQEPDAIIMDDEQQWPEDAGVPEYADEYGAAGPQDLPPDGECKTLGKSLVIPLLSGPLSSS